MSTTAPERAPAGWDELFAQQQEVTRALMDRHEELAELLLRLDAPASIEAVQLSSTQPVQEFNAVGGTLSVGLLNPQQSPNAIALGVFGSATAPDAIEVAAGGLVVLPIKAGVLEVAAVGAIAAGVTVYAYLLRFPTVQTAHYS